MSETTARPWEIRKDHLGSWWVVDLAERRVCYVGHQSNARAEGDARLIVDAVNAVQAPELLAALEKARQIVRSYYDAAVSDGFEGPSIFDMAGFELLMRDADTVIAAARGLEDS